MATYKVGYLIGSLAKESINRKLAQALIGLAPPGLKFHEIEIGNLPLYSYDYDANFPPVATAFKQSISDSDAVLFVTPDEAVVAGRDQFSSNRIIQNHFVRDATGKWGDMREDASWPDNLADLKVAPVEVRSKTYRQLFVDGKRVGPPFE